MKRETLVRRVFLGAGLVLGLQALVWLASGLVMAFLPEGLVRGEITAYSAPERALDAQTYASPGGAIAQAQGATSVELKRFLGRPVYVTKGPGAAAIFDAASSEKLTPLKEGDARRVAKQDYVGAGDIERATLVSFPPREYRGETPVWRIDFNDKHHTRLYISPDTGEVRARRNDIWRLHEFVRMLHVMDYGPRNCVSGPFLVIVSAAGLVFALSGLAILFMRLRRRKGEADAAAEKPASAPDGASVMTGISNGNQNAK